MMRDRTKPTNRPAAAPGDPGLGNVLFDTWLVSRAVHALIDQAIEATGLDADEFAVYSLLASSEQTTPTALARWMAAPPTTVSSYVKRFERRGHLERITNPDDGRSHLLQLTKSGRQAHRQAGELFAPVLADIEQRLGSGSQQTRRKLQALHRTVEDARRSVEALEDQ